MVYPSDLAVGPEGVELAHPSAESDRTLAELARLVLEAQLAGKLSATVSASPS